jgi:hypothetical protein
MKLTNLQLNVLADSLFKKINEAEEKAHAKLIEEIKQGRKEIQEAAQKYVEEELAFVQTYIKNSASLKYFLGITSGILNKTSKELLNDIKGGYFLNYPEELINFPMFQPRVSYNRVVSDLVQEITFRNRKDVSDVYEEILKKYSINE